MPLVSVVITVFNRPERIPKVIQTVLEQTFQDFEIIVADGARSQRNNLEVGLYAKKDKRIKYLPVEKEAVNYISYKGIQHSRNVGCKAAKGKYIAMLDDDDSWDKDKLEIQIQAFRAHKKLQEITSNKDLGLVLCYTKIETDDGEIIDKTKLYPTYKDLLQAYNLSSTSSYLIRADILKEIGYWNEELRGMHEYDIALKLSKLGYLIYTIPEVLMIRNRISNITVESGHYYYFKIAEIVDLWKYYGKDFLPKLGIKGFLFNVAKTILLFELFLFGYIVKEKIWKVIYPLKKLYEQGVS